MAYLDYDNASMMQQQALKRDATWLISGDYVNEVNAVIFDLMTRMLDLAEGPDTIGALGDEALSSMVAALRQTHKVRTIPGRFFNPELPTHLPPGSHMRAMMEEGLADPALSGLVANIHRHVDVLNTTDDMAAYRASIAEVLALCGKAEQARSLGFAPAGR